MMHRQSEQFDTEQRYAPHRKHPELFGDKFREEWLHPDVVQILKTLHTAATTTTCTPTRTNTNTNTGTSPSDMDMEGLAPMLHKEAPEIYSFHCLSSKFLQLLNEELAHFYHICETHKIPFHRPNSMNNYGVVVNQIGMKAMITDFQRILWPLTNVLFPLQSFPSFDDHHSFIVKYSANEDLGLDMHIDDSDVTLNVCLGDTNFTGATLVFCGMFAAKDHRKVSHVYHHQVGRAILHLGTRRHGAETIISGTRTNLIVWNHNHGTYRRSSQYQSLRNFENYQTEEGPPDVLCLSNTHDRDYFKYKQTMSSSTRNPIGHPPWCPPPGKEYPGYYDDDDDDDESIKEQH